MLQFVVEKHSSFAADLDAAVRAAGASGLVDGKLPSFGAQEAELYWQMLFSAPPAKKQWTLHRLIRTDGIAVDFLYKKKETLGLSRMPTNRMAGSRGLRSTQLNKNWRGCILSAWTLADGTFGPFLVQRTW